jgi:hypothetical protein
MAPAHEFLILQGTVALRKNDPVKRFEVVAAIKVD